MQVVLSVNNLHASATFISHQPEVRQALQDAIPKLREMLGQSGIQLGDCNVNSQAQQQAFAQSQSQSNAQSGRSGGASSANAAAAASATSVGSVAPRGGVGLVDTFV
jgi:flagellar hook-length control protein FliK